MVNFIVAKSIKIISIVLSTETHQADYFFSMNLTKNKISLVYLHWDNLAIKL